MRFYVHPAAVREFDEAEEHYKRIEQTLADRLLEETTTVRQMIDRHPKAYVALDEVYRSASLDTFPYSLIYREYADGIAIVAFVHQRRRPHYWRRRKMSD